jgi:homospermidine synthase
MTEQTHPVYAEITGPIVMIGFGSIGRGTLPLIERHFKFDKSRLVVIDPREEPSDMEILKQHGVRHIKEYVTKDNYKELLKPLLTEGGGQGFCVNLSVDTGSLDLMKLCRKLDVLYIDTVVEPWLGFYFDKNMKNADRTNYALRETLRHEKKKSPGGTTAVSTCGANPGMVSWFVKQALVNLANDTGLKFDEPDQHDREGWAKLMKKLGVKGVHIAERDTQRAKNPKPLNVFWNTWSVEGFISEGLQPAELGWGTHENWMPKNAKKHKKGCKAAIYLDQPGANTRVRTWCPTPGPQYGFLVTHNESISIADYFTVRDKDGEVTFRPTCHYAYHPANDAFCRCMRCSATAAPRSRFITFSTSTSWSTASTNSACCSTATRRTPTGSARACRWKRPAASRRTRTPPACRSPRPFSPAWSGRSKTRRPASSKPTRSTTSAASKCSCLISARSKVTTPTGPRSTVVPGLFPEDIDTKDPWQFKNILVR